MLHKTSSLEGLGVRVRDIQVVIGVRLFIVEARKLEHGFRRIND